MPILTPPAPVCCESDPYNQNLFLLHEVFFALCPTSDAPTHNAIISIDQHRNQLNGIVAQSLYMTSSPPVVCSVIWTPGFRARLVVIMNLDLSLLC